MRVPCPAPSGEPLPGAARAQPGGSRRVPAAGGAGGRPPFPGGIPRDFGREEEEGKGGVPAGAVPAGGRAGSRPLAFLGLDVLPASPTPFPAQPALPRRRSPEKWRRAPNPPSPPSSSSSSSSPGPRPQRWAGKFGAEGGSRRPAAECRPLRGRSLFRAAGGRHKVKSMRILRLLLEKGSHMLQCLCGRRLRSSNSPGGERASLSPPPSAPNPGAARPGLAPFPRPPHPLPPPPFPPPPPPSPTGARALSEVLTPKLRPGAFPTFPS